MLQFDTYELDEPQLEVSKDFDQVQIKNPRLWGFFQFVRWRGLEPPRLAAHGPQPCLSANSSTSA